MHMQIHISIIDLKYFHACSLGKTLIQFTHIEVFLAQLFPHYSYLNVLKTLFLSYTIKLTCHDNFNTYADLLAHYVSMS